MPGRSTPMIRRSCSSANAPRLDRHLSPRAGRAVHPDDGAAPRGTPNSAKESRRPSRTATDPSRRGRRRRSWPDSWHADARSRDAGTGRPAQARAAAGRRRRRRRCAGRGRADSAPSPATGPLDDRGEHAGDVVAATGRQRRVRRAASAAASSSWRASTALDWASGTRSVSPSLASSTRSPGTRSSSVRSPASRSRRRRCASRRCATGGCGPRRRAGCPRRPAAARRCGRGDPGAARRRGRRSRASRPGAPARTAAPSVTTAVSVVAIPAAAGSRRTPSGDLLLREPVAASSSVDRVGAGSGERARRDDVRRGRRGDLAGGRSADTVGDQHAGGPTNPESSLSLADQARRGWRPTPENLEHCHHLLLVRTAVRAEQRSRRAPTVHARVAIRHNGRHGVAAARDLRGPGARLRRLRRGRVLLRRRRPRRRREGRQRGRQAGRGRADWRCAASPRSSPAPRSASP